MEKHHWMELVPVDRYKVRASGMLHEFDRKILTMLYQPLIGSNGLSLYMTLWSELDQRGMWGEEMTHHTLMIQMHRPLKDIYEERLKLEGIGLLKVHMNKEDDVRSFIYELVPPLSPKVFFDDAVLNIFIYHRLGKTKYNSVKNFFLYPEVDTTMYKEVTRSFNEVFSSMHPSQLQSSLQSHEAEELFQVNGQELLDRTDKSTVNIYNDFFNFDLFYEGLSDAVIPKKAVTEKVKEAIVRLAFLYGIDHLQMKNVLMSAITGNEAIDIEQLRKSAREWYQFENGDAMPALTERIQPVKHQTMTKKEPVTEEERFVKELEQTSPRQLLVELSGGAEPSASDLKIIEDVMFKQKLLPGVINVLVHYVMLRTDMKLTKGYVEKIASHWARKKIRTVREAMAIAKEEHRQYQQWAETKNNPKAKGRSQKGTRTEMLPEWFGNNKVEEPVSEQPTNQEDEERRKLQEKLQKFQKNKVSKEG
ncbi:replication initiation and membrane attachment family protein [Priestia taiwanensis]|uniref:Replication initiation and membrane attachment protein n=1 Tax=Priestia taiwanensis TaxID=1347902 RepID=A0A917ET45_9BACI|nr:replication initiation and membrane attachment family protein [Priestia taiwanensis]MBM7363483.1 replication initiation and membrane attachment protein [Priestia taiwanensis]GGE76785.1 replication initiation and membrane attachment protein [Priestia taiwanensis]